MKHENDVNVFQCGGTLIDSQYVVTVAHCVAKFANAGATNLKVRLGEWDTAHTKEFYPHADYDVIDIVIHPNFQNRSLWNDIALLKLNQIVEFRPNIDTVCLPGADEVFDGQQCITTGWGKNSFSKCMMR